MRILTKSTLLAAALFSLTMSQAALAQEKVLNLYSARHYSTDEALYNNFTKATGIVIKRFEAGDEALIERLKSEGDKSPADVIMMVDAARLWKSQVDGLFAPIQSKVLEAAIPAHLQASDKSWFGFSTRARVIVYNKASVKPTDVDTYEKLADPVNKGKLCTRSGTHPYNLSLFSSIVEHQGVDKAEAVLRGMVANMARAPKGGDTDQIVGVGTGECGIAITNTYYWARLLRSTKPADIETVSKVGMIWPNQSGAGLVGRGAHFNVAGGAVAKHSKNKAAAQQFLEYLVSPQAQSYFADGNNEWPVTKDAKINNPALASLGSYKVDTLPIASIGLRTVTAARLLDKVGYK